MQLLVLNAVSFAAPFGATGALHTAGFRLCQVCLLMQDGKEEQLLVLVNGTICLSGIVQLSGEDCSLFSESFVLCPTQSGHHYIKHQMFKVHKQTIEDII